MQTDKNIRIVLVCGSYPPARCGIGDYSSFLCEAIAKAGADVSVITSSYLSIPQSSAPVKVLPLIKDWNLKYAGNILKQILNQSPDIVQFQYPNLEYKKNLSFNFLPGMLKKASPSIKIVETFHEPLRDLKFLGKMRMLINISRADGFIFVEKENYASLPFYYKILIGSKPLSTIPIGSNVPVCERDPNFKRKLFNDFKITGDLKLIMTFGFITQVKGYELLLDTYNPEKEVWVHLGLKDKKEPYYEHFLSLAKEKGLLDHIYFTGELSAQTIGTYLASSDVCVFPFKEGTTPRHGTFLAAAAQGSYIVASHSVKRGYTEKENIYYVTPNDREALRTAIAFKPTTEKASIPLVPSWDTIAASHIKLYSDLL
ncbi:MAG: glycosyltransferase [bacterium]